ncbi:unnamed protein product [Miscanthus lutarioriparius]|uniref:F-box protein n=1 Tax=Miscanthus lutarioriparius TaxID=422564 RepID=A0A811P8B7_9POAL|nr:unnamed protein product [Miscanthus lutarioriparius]
MEAAPRRQQKQQLEEEVGCPCGGFEAADQFERLHDVVLLDVLNRIGDVKALGRCALVSRRFHALVPLVDSVFVRVDCVIHDDQPPSSSSSSSAGAAPGSPPHQAPAPAARGRGALAHIARVLLGGIARPIHALGQILSPAAAAVSRRSEPPLPASPPAPVADVSHHSPSEVLHSFKELRRLHIELPTGELGIDDGVLLKWKADFGSTLGSCVILGASSVSSKPPTGSTQAETAAADSAATAPDTSRETEEPGSLPDSLYTNGGLKLRVVWAISSLIAASARHYLLHPIICNHETLESLDLTDADGQGVLTMDRRQLQELRKRPVSPSGSSHRTLMPALSMRLHYAPLIELPGGTLLKGATLVAIRPSEDALREGQGVGAAGPVGTCWISEAFEEPYRTAAKVLLKRRAYCLEMNSF